MENTRILIVEDEEIIRIGLKDNFELENYIVETAGDGDEAIQKADSFLPHLVILDLMIPKKSGFEVCRYIRKKHPDTFIIMLTAKTEESSKEIFKLSKLLLIIVLASSIVLTPSNNS